MELFVNNQLFYAMCFCFTEKLLLKHHTWGAKSCSRPTHSHLLENSRSLPSASKMTCECIHACSSQCCELIFPPPLSMYFLCDPCYLHPLLHHRDNADDFIAAHRLSDMLVKINLDESASRNQGSVLGLPLTQMGSVHGRPTELGTGKNSYYNSITLFAYCPAQDSVTPFLTAIQSWLHLILQWTHICTF